jgi:D-3-phosphoglycerate dehydrogenase
MAIALEGTVGIIGFGMIARSLAKFLSVFPLDGILAYDPFVDASVMAAYGVKKCELKDIQRQANIISVHAPSLPETQRIISRDFLEGLENNIIFVNTARGQLVDEAALVDALNSGKVLAAGLDVLDEPGPPDKRLFTMPNVVITPHVATNNLRCRISVNKFCVQTTLDFFAGKPIKSLLNPAYKENARQI